MVRQPVEPAAAVAAGEYERKPGEASNDERCPRNSGGDRSTLYPPAA